jgi:hypothetical protein
LTTDTDNTQTFRQQLVAEAVKKWIEQSFDPSGNNRLLYYRNLKVGTLSFADADPIEFSSFLNGNKARLSKLFEDPDKLVDSARRCRAIRAKAQQGLGRTER